MSSCTMSIGFIGGGNMSTVIFKAVLKAGCYTGSNVTVSGPHIQNLKHFQEQGATVTSDNCLIFNNCNVIFLGVKPDKLDTSLKSCGSSNVKSNTLFVSMLAGIKIATLQEALDRYLPGQKISVVRIMPNTPMSVGKGICLYTPDSTVTDPQCILLENLLSSSALVEKVPEALMDSLGALTACGPAFMYLVIEALADGAVKQGVPRNLATRHAAQMLVGSGEMVLKSGKHPGLLKDEVCSPNGSTICGVASLENGQVRATMINAIEASCNQNKVLGAVKSPHS